MQHNLKKLIICCTILIVIYFQSTFPTWFTFRSTNYEIWKETMEFSRANKRTGVVQTRAN